MSILSRQNVLKLNKLWFAYDFITVRKAFEAICSANPETGEPPLLAMDITYAETDADGNFLTDSEQYCRPVGLDEWMTLPVRSIDEGIMCARRLIRVPTILICSNYADVPEYVPKFSPEGVRERDNHTCQVTKRKLAPGEGDMAHDIAKSKGGQKTWKNIAYVTKELNRAQGTKTFAEMGWNIKPTVPHARRALIRRRDARHPSHLGVLRID